MNEITISPATLCFASLIIAILADELRLLITVIRAPRLNKAQMVHSQPIQPPEQDVAFAPNKWVRVLCLPIDLAALGVLLLGLYHAQNVGTWIVGGMSAIFLAFVYSGIPNTFFPIHRTDNVLDRIKTRRERYWVKRAAVVVAAVLYRAAVWLVGIQPSSIWLWAIALMCFLIAFVRPAEEWHLDNLGYNTEGTNEEHLDSSGDETAV